MGHDVRTGPAVKGLSCSSASSSGPMHPGEVGRADLAGRRSLEREWRGGDGHQPSPCWDFEEQHAPVGENQRTAYLSRLLYLTFRLSLWRISLETIPLYESVISFMWEIYCPLPVTGYLYHMFKYLELLRQYTSLSLCGIFSPTKRKAMNCLRGRISSFSQMTCSKMLCSFF